MPHQVGLGIAVQEQQRGTAAADPGVDRAPLGLELAGIEPLEHHASATSSSRSAGRPGEAQRHRVRRGEPGGGGVGGGVGGDPAQVQRGRPRRRAPCCPRGHRAPTRAGTPWPGPRRPYAPRGRSGCRATLIERQRRNPRHVGERLHGDQPSGHGGGDERIHRRPRPSRRGAGRRGTRVPRRGAPAGPGRVSAPDARGRTRARPGLPRTPPAGRPDPRPRAPAPARTPPRRYARPAAREPRAARF